MKQKLLLIISFLFILGQTAYSQSIYEIAEKYFKKDGNNRIILATDGDLNVGVSSEADLINLVSEKKETGVFLSCLGFGDGNYKDNKMEALADYGNGNYSYIDCTMEADKVLNEELYLTIITVAKDVKFQIEFNPSTVKGYRLIGYENRTMAAEDFNDDTKEYSYIGSYNDYKDLESKPTTVYTLKTYLNILEASINISEVQEHIYQKVGQNYYKINASDIIDHYYLKGDKNIYTLITDFN